MAAALALAYEAPRAAVRATVTGLPAGTASITIERTGPSGTVAGVRGAVGLAAAAGVTQIVRDYEAPLGVPLTYRLRVYNAAGAQLETTTQPITLPAAAGDDPWLVDLAAPLNSQPIIVESIAELTYETATGIHRVIDRRAPVLTSALAWTPSGELVFVTVDELAHDRARAALGTGVPVLIRLPVEQGFSSNLYLGVTGFKIARVSRIAFADERRFTVQVVQVDRPDPSVFAPAAPVTYAQVKATYATYAALKAAVPDYDSLANNFAGGGAYVYGPWPPEDV